MRPTRFPARDTPDQRLLGFMRHLRLNGYGTGSAEAADALAVLSGLDPTDPAAARLALRCLTARTADETRRFDGLYDAFWFNTGRGERAGPARPAADGPGREGPGRSAGPGAATGGGSDRDGAAGEGRLQASRAEAVARTDLRRLTSPEEMAEAAAVAERLASALRDRLSRRWRAARRGRALDLRRTLRAAVARGGEPLDLHPRRHPDRPLHITALLDVSGSMTVHARLFLAFLRGLTGADLRCDAFLFHTRLVRITEALRDRDTLRAATRLGLLAEGFGGGTRIGGALTAFADRHGAGLTRRSVLLIVSDGYDTGPPDRIAAALARLRRRAGRIVWLNPLKGWVGYAPVAAGMAAALPHLDAFRAASTLADLAALEPEFARL